MNDNETASKLKIPFWEKTCLTVEEAAAYSGIGINRINEMARKPNCKFTLWVGKKKLIKRKVFDQFIENETEI